MVWFARFLSNERGPGRAMRADREGKVRGWLACLLIARGIAQATYAYLSWQPGYWNWRVKRRRFRSRHRLSLAVDLWHYSQLPAWSRRRARRILRRTQRRYPFARELYASIASPVGMGNDGRKMYDAATRTWFGNVVGLVTLLGKPFIDISGVQYAGGADYSGILDATSAFAAGLAAVPAAGGAIILLAGTLTITAQLSPVAKTHIFGLSQQATTIEANSGSADLFNISVSYLTFSDFTINSTLTPAQQTGGAAFHWVAGSNTSYRIQNVDLNNVFDGFVVDNDSVGFIWWDTIELLNWKDRGFWWKNNNTNGNHWLSHGVLSNQFYGAPANSIGLELNTTQSVWFTAVDVTFAGLYAWRCNTSVGAAKQVAQLWFTGCLGDHTSGGPNWSFVDGSGRADSLGLTKIFGDRCWSANAGGGSGWGVEFVSGSEYQWADQYTYANGRYGVYIQTNVLRVELNGGMVGANSQNVSGNDDGIRVQAGASDFRIHDVTSGPLAGLNSQRYGIYVEAGGSNSYEITDNNLRGNVTGALSDNGTGAAKRIAHNAGFNPRGAGGPQPAVPASTVTVQNASGMVAKVYISGGTYTQVTLFTPGSGGTALGPVTQIEVAPEASVGITYTVAPTWNWYYD